jgi:hypothetical protein
MNPQQEKNITIMKYIYYLENSIFYLLITRMLRRGFIRKLHIKNPPTESSHYTQQTMHTYPSYNKSINNFKIKAFYSICERALSRYARTWLGNSIVVMVWYTSVIAQRKPLFQFKSLHIFISYQYRHASYNTWLTRRTKTEPFIQQQVQYLP